MANKTTFYVRIYSRHDYDLMMYYLSLRSCEGAGNREFSKITKTVLRDYVSGNKTKIPIVTTQADIVPKGSIKTRFTLDDEEDKEIIELLHHVYKRQMNSFIKNLLRFRIADNQLNSYFATSIRSYPAVIEGTNDKPRKKKTTVSKNVRYTTEKQASQVVVKQSADIRKEKEDTEKIISTSPNEQKYNIQQPINVFGSAAPKNNDVLEDEQKNANTDGFNIFGALEQAMNFGQ